MAMSDCVKCWETPCVCGHDYMDRSEKWIEDQIEMLKEVLEKKRANKPKPVVDETIIVVQSHPNDKFVGEFQAMVMQRINRKTVGLYPAQVIYGGHLTADVVQEGGVAHLSIGSRKYQISVDDPLYPRLKSNVGQNYAVMRHHTMHYLVPTVTAGGHADMQFLAHPKEGK